MKKELSKKNNNESQTSEIKRYLGVLHEDYSSKLDLVVEQFGGINKKLDSHTEMTGRIAEDVEIIKNDIEFLKGGMKKKVDYEEFQALEKRTSLLESKVRR